jgi:cyanophycinase
LSKNRRGSLILIGGREEKENGRERLILAEVARRAAVGGGRLVIVTVATRFHEEAAEEYGGVFADLGVPEIEVLGVRSRRDAYDETMVERVAGAAVIFFAGGDQLRITSQMGNSPVFRRMQRLYEAEGATIVGTSAGAAAMPETMVVGGPGYESNRISALSMAPGLGLFPRVVVDSHFAQRGRFGRLLGAVAQNPRNLGLGIDENTAIVTEGLESFQVLGTGAVYVLDGSEVSHSSLSEDSPEGVISLFDVRLHVLRAGDRYDLRIHRPSYEASGPE